LWISTTSPAWAGDPFFPPALDVLGNPVIGPRIGQKIGIHVHDDNADGVSSLDPIPYFIGVTFQTGVDIWMPATEPPDGKISFINEPRGDADRPQAINVPNWASDAHRISLQFNDYAQDINSWGECKRAKPSPCK